MLIQGVQLSKLPIPGCARKADLRNWVIDWAFGVQRQSARYEYAVFSFLEPYFQSRLASTWSSERAPWNLRTSTKKAGNTPEDWSFSNSLVKASLPLI